MLVFILLPCASENIQIIVLIVILTAFL
jgi:hypothetical protein